MKDLVFHVTKDCDKATKACERCNALVKRKDETRHVAFDCPKTKSAQCYLCFENLLEEEEITHFQTCKGAGVKFTCSERGTFFRNDATGCGKTIALTEATQHWLSDCAGVKVSCGLCQQAIAATERGAHLMSCTGLKVKCPYCEELLKPPDGQPRETLDWTTVVLKHCFSTCQKMQLACGWCRCMVLWKDMPAHLIGTDPSVLACPAFAAECPLRCKKIEDLGGMPAHGDPSAQPPESSFQQIVWSKLPEHLICGDGDTAQISTHTSKMSLCQEYRVRCQHEAKGNKCCFPKDVPAETRRSEDFSRGSRMLRGRLPHHYAHECAGVEITCKNEGADGKCRKKFAAKDWQKHAGECPYRLLVCGTTGGSGGCGLRIPAVEMEKHRKEGCVSSKEECPYGCGQELLSVLMRLHKAECPCRKVVAHTKLTEGHGKLEPVPHRTVKIHKAPYPSHPGQLYYPAGRTATAVFSLGLSLIDPNQRKHLWNCCDCAEDEPAEGCTRPRWQCGECDHILKAPIEEGVFIHGCTHQCQVCGADQGSHSSKSFFKQACQEVCADCRLDPKRSDTESPRICSRGA